MNETASSSPPRNRPPGQPDWITPIPVPRPTASMRQIGSSPRSDEPGLEAWLRDICQDLALEWQGAVEVMWICESHRLDTPIAWFFCADIAGHRIHITGWDAEPIPYSETRFAIAIDGLQLAYLPRSGSHLRRDVVEQLKAAHVHLAHTGTTVVPQREQPSRLVAEPRVADNCATAMERASDEHRELFVAISARTGLRPHLWQSGGRRITMVILIPLDVKPGRGRYLGTVEAYDDNGDASGSITFHADSDETGEDDQGETVFLAWDTCPISLWANAIADHYDRLRARQPALDPSASTAQPASPHEEA